VEELYRMVDAESVRQMKKTEKVLWEYVVEPVNKPTYWDHAALPTEERRARARRNTLVEQRKEVGSAMDDVDDDVAICKLLKKPLKANVEELVKTKPEPLSGRISGLLEEPLEEGRNTLVEQRKEVGSAMDDVDDDVAICKLLKKPLKANVEEHFTTMPEPLSGRISGLLAEPSEEGSIIEEDDDNVLIYKLLKKTVKSLRDKSHGTKNMTEVKCAERGGSGMLLWQHEFYFVLENEELSRRQHAPPKPCLYQALQFRRGMELPEDQKMGMTRKQLGEMWVLGVAYAPAVNIRMYSSREKGYLFHSEFNDTDARTGLFWRCPEVVGWIIPRHGGKCRKCC
jgi:hypothetical protein